jgi:hypothetical protein
MCMERASVPVTTEPDRTGDTSRLAGSNSSFRNRVLSIDKYSPAVGVATDTLVHHQPRDTS